MESHEEISAPSWTVIVRAGRRNNPAADVITEGYRDSDSSLNIHMMREDGIEPNLRIERSACDLLLSS
jgi:hypothetical protein